MFEYLKRALFCFQSIRKQYIEPYNKKKYGRIGKQSIVKNNSLLVPENMFIDDYVVIQEQTNFISNKGKLYVGKYSVISAGCTIVPGSHLLTVGVPFYLATTSHVNDEESDIIIDEDCWIGAGCILLPQCHIGRGAVVGAGSVVKKDIPPYAIVVGSPARIIAAKFSLEQVLKHETILYPPNDRFSKEELERIYAEYYKDMRTIGVDNLSTEEVKELEVIRDSFGMINYTNY